MIKRILPIYQTGWFYLLLIFWGMSFWYISIGGINQANQLNLNLLDYLTSSQEQPKSDSSLTATDILTLHSSFDEGDIPAIRALLSYYPESQITLLGNQSKAFIEKLKVYLSSRPRVNKVIIASNHSYSGTAVKIQSTMMLSNFLNWFRFYQYDNVKEISSEQFIYSPLRLNQRQSYPLLWQSEGETYLSLLSEILKQLSKGNELFLSQHWQLSLIITDNKAPNDMHLLGFSGSVYTTGKTYSKDIRDNGTRKHNLTSVKQYIEQRHVNSTAKLPYKVIIISDNTFEGAETVKPLLVKLAGNNYLSQNILTILLGWVFAAIGLVLVYLIRCLPLKQQLTAVIAYVLSLFIYQYFEFSQQQWFEVLPILILITGSCLLQAGYQNEYSLFLSALDSQPQHEIDKSKSKNIPPKKSFPSRSKPTYKSPQNFSPTSQIEATPSSITNENLTKSFVLVESTLPSQSTAKDQLTIKSFGRYQVEGVLGKGAMGIVYQGVDPKINRHVAIKTLQLTDDVDSKASTEAKDRFFREAQTAGGLSHANIVTIYDVGEENNLGYIAMDLLTGAPLSLFTQPDQTLPVPLVYKLLMQITDALDYAHAQDVVHRDIKPANIIYDDDLLKVTVTDFGIAYVSDNSKTRTGIIMGSPYYMSPEQILGLKVDGRSDIFSLGVTFYQLLCGQLPFEGESIATVAYQITKEKAVAVNQHNTKLPASALRITNKAMHKDKDKRYQTMAEFKLALITALKRDFKLSVS